jgi:dihydroorotate dehydrogenase
MLQANKLIRSIVGLSYKLLVKPILFKIDPEIIHDQALKIGNFLGQTKFGQNFTASCLNYENKILEQTINGLTFSNPVGLAAGFDKNALLTNIASSIGFGFIEIGSITGRPCQGNNKPRLWRYPKSDSLAVYYGLANEGANNIAQRLNKKLAIPLGINIAKTNDQLTDEPEAAILDYLTAFKAIKDLADYVTINISCPNTSGGQPFIDPILLERLLSAIGKENNGLPLFIKLSPDLTITQLENILEVISRHRITGLICSNLTHAKNYLDKDEQNFITNGGLSGKAVEEVANKLLKTVYQKTKNKYILIGCGGIFSAADAYKKIKLGATLVQLITGMIYEGPQLIGEINAGLVELLKRDGYKNISDAIGVDAK